MEESEARWQLKNDIRPPVRVGFWTVFICFFAVGAWAAIAPLSSAAIAPGQVSPDGSSRVIQHLEGGIVRQLHTREGDTVQKGDVLIVLDRVLAEANQVAKLKKLHRLKVTLARLQAQQDDAAEFVVPAIEGSDLKDKELQQFGRNQLSIFQLGRQMAEERALAFDAQIAQVNNEILSIRAQIAGIDAQQAFIDKEITAKKKLVGAGLVRLPELYVLQRQSAEFEAQKDSLGSTIARASQKRSEIEVAKINLRTEMLDKTSAEISEVSKEIAQAEEALNATSDVLGRTIIYSPIEGKILNLAVKTIGGVVRPGEPIATIVPSNDELIVDARLSPTDIDNVSTGMIAKVQINSFMARHMLPLEGIVTQIGADVVADPENNEKYYPLRVSVASEEQADIPAVISLKAGMPADVFIQTGVHTPLRYMFDPIRRSFNRSFREEPL